ncbi:MAG: hypothetical protein ACM3OO_03590 [Planctomycetaceae bacterium]
MSFQALISARSIRRLALAVALSLTPSLLPGVALASTGALTPLGCVADPVNNPDTCGQTAKGLDTAFSAAVSRDGRSVYVVGAADNAIVRFKRDSTTGALTPRGCVADVTNDPDGCALTAKGLMNPQMVAISRDGTSVYVVGGVGTIVRFARDTKTGALVPKGCTGDKGNNPSGCAKVAKGMGGADAVAVSPDGRSVYVAAYDDETIVRFDRDRTTGALTARGCIAERGYNPAGCAQTIIGGLQEPYIGSVTVSPDGTSVYAAGSAGPSIAMFRRTSTGALKPRGCIADPANNPESCVLTAKGLANPYRVVVSPDGASVYAADYLASGVVRFTRDLSTGSLKGKGCVADPAHDTVGCAQTAPGLYGTEWVAISADGRSVYATGTNASAIVRFARDRTTGALTPKGCIGDVVNNPSNCVMTAKGLSNVQSLALSADGTSLYAPSPLDNSITRFRRAT